MFPDSGLQFGFSQVHVCKVKINIVTKLLEIISGAKNISMAASTDDPALEGDPEGDCL